MQRQKQSYFPSETRKLALGASSNAQRLADALKLPRVLSMIKSSESKKH